jgi:hypothetical protein
MVTYLISDALHFYAGLFSLCYTLTLFIYPSPFRR